MFMQRAQKQPADRYVPLLRPAVCFISIYLLVRARVRVGAGWMRV